MTERQTKQTPRRTVRVADQLWQAAQDRADARNETVADVVRKALERYVGRKS